jgi:hypothetical protein
MAVAAAPAPADAASAAGRVPPSTPRGYQTAAHLAAAGAYVFRLRAAKLYGFEVTQQS